MDTTIRRAVLRDAAALAELHLDVWDETYTGRLPQEILDARRRDPVAERTARWEQRIADGTTWVAEHDGALVGFVSAGPGRDEPKTLELMALYVRARIHGTGVGHALMEAAIGDQPAYLWVLEGNDRAITFYQRHGFRLDGQQKLEDERPALRMVRP